MHCSSVTSLLLRCHIGTWEFIVSRSTFVTVSNFGLPSAFFSPVSFASGRSTSICIGQRI